MITIQLTKSECDRVVAIVEDNLPYAVLTDRAALEDIITTIRNAPAVSPPWRAAVILTPVQWHEVSCFIDEYDVDEAAIELLNKIGAGMEAYADAEDGITAGGVE